MAAKLSKQRRWQLKQEALGRCKQCGLARVPESPAYCLTCYVKMRLATRARQKNRPWKKGGPGRPPQIENFEDRDG